VGFDCDGVDCGSGDIAVEVIIMSIFFKVESRDETIHESMATREVTIKFIKIVQDRGEIVVNATAISTDTRKATKLRKWRHFNVVLKGRRSEISIEFLESCCLFCHLGTAVVSRYRWLQMLETDIHPSRYMNH